MSHEKDKPQTMVKTESRAHQEQFTLVFSRYLLIGSVFTAIFAGMIHLIFPYPQFLGFTISVLPAVVAAWLHPRFCRRGQTKTGVYVQLVACIVSIAVAPLLISDIMPAASISYVLIATVSHMFLGTRGSRWITGVCILAFAVDIILLNTWSANFPPLDKTIRLVTGVVIGPFILTIAVLVIRSITLEREKAIHQAQQANLEIARHEQTDAQRAQVEAERERLRQQVLDVQREIIRELSTPIIPIMETPQGGIIVMPLIGRVDGMRARDITRRLLVGIREHRAKVVIMDITGVPVVDSDVANRLYKTIQAARLKGAHTIITGISDIMAEIIVDLGIDWSGIETHTDLQTGLRAALPKIGQRIEG